MDELGRKLRSRVFGVKLLTGAPPEYRPRENDDRSRLILKSWLELEKKRSLVRSSPLKEEEDEIAERRFYRTANVIAIVYDQIRSETEDVATILENNDDCLCALFQLAYVVVSFNFCFDGIKSYEIILTQILDIASNPTPQNLQREGAFLSAAESVTKVLDAAVCEDGELKNLCRKIFDVARDSDQASTIMARVSALKTLHNGTTILSKKRKFPAASSIPPSLPSAEQLPQKSDLQQTTGDKHLSSKLKWILHILKHMSLQYKNHVFSPTLDFRTSSTVASTAEEGEARGLLPALHWALKFGFKDIEQETDCLNVAMFLQGRKCNIHRVSRTILLDVQELSLLFVYFLVLHAPRVCNNVAHLLAASGSTLGTQNWFDAAPALIAHMLSLEASFCSDF